ncbi:MAG: GPW/gp25 family protein [Synergistaceae bacterium]|jgi:phage baseplate assembly protein W|nr:GPW/gp25 family protein [Synergistaceae bacterium]
MELDITAKLEEIDFAPANVVAEIMQNVRIIFTTMKYSVPLDRLFGVDAVMLDRPMPKAMAALQAEIVAAIHRYEPRCRVTKVSFDGDLDGRLVPKVRIKIDEERLVSDTA